MAAKKQELDLGSIWLFSACPASQLRMIRRAVEEIDVPAGVVLCEEGSVGREFFYIVEGSATVKHGGRRITSLGPGRYFGELSLLDRRPRNATIISETPMKLVVLEQRKFNALLDATPGMSHKLLVAMAERLREADKKEVMHMTRLA
jgi:CRP-like cAMP-binding protein